MIEAYIIDQIRRQEEQQRRDSYERPALELPLPVYQPSIHDEQEAQSEPKRVIVIEL